MSIFASDRILANNRFNSDGSGAGTAPCNRTEIGPSNRVNTGRDVPVSSSIVKSIKSSASCRFEIERGSTAATGKGFTVNDPIISMSARVTEFDAGVGVHPDRKMHETANSRFNILFTQSCSQKASLRKRKHSLPTTTTLDRCHKSYAGIWAKL